MNSRVQDIVANLVQMIPSEIMFCEGNEPAYNWLRSGNTVVTYTTWCERDETQTIKAGSVRVTDIEVTDGEYTDAERAYIVAEMTKALAEYCAKDRWMTYTEFCDWVCKAYMDEPMPCEDGEFMWGCEDIHADGWRAGIRVDGHMDMCEHYNYDADYGISWCAAIEYKVRDCELVATETYIAFDGDGADIADKDALAAYDAVIDRVLDKFDACC